jgi:hypothetical protein
MELNSFALVVDGFDEKNDVSAGSRNERLDGGDVIWSASTAWPFFQIIGRLGDPRTADPTRKRLDTWVTFRGELREHTQD